MTNTTKIHKTISFKIVESCARGILYHLTKENIIIFTSPLYSPFSDPRVRHKQNCNYKTMKKKMGPVHTAERDRKHYYHGKSTVTDYGKKENTNAKKQECDRD